MNIKLRFQRQWNDDEAKTGDVLPRMLLRILSLPYSGAVLFRNILCDRRIIRQERLPCPVLSVGNITVGGTGKTPTVIMIAKLLQQHRYRPAVLSRGYGGKSGSPVNVVSDGKTVLMGWKEAGDEPVLMANSLPGIPVLTGANRFLTGSAALEKFGADILILDDAFQHRQLFRDLDLVLLDSARPFGNGFLLPRGPLRESPSALARADMLLRTGLAEKGEPLPVKTKFNVCNIELPSFRGVHRPTGIVSGKTGHSDPPEALRGEKIMAFSGLGSPESFRKGLAALGAAVVSYRDFPDHHPYSDADIVALRRLATQSGASLLVTTEKDGVRLADFPDFLAEVSLLRISMEITPFLPFSELLFSRLHYR
ncbi:MAG: tetraacyldisaccharide 4'-kinase [Syntrophales bacterium]|nr:tetraacyldisaccharide 4'-kinase [Syntrophales bacterium]